MPPPLEDEELQEALDEARANLEDETTRTRAGFSGECRDPGRPVGGDRLNLADVPAIKKKFAFLAEFTDSFIMSHPLETLLKMETTPSRYRSMRKERLPLLSWPRTGTLSPLHTHRWCRGRTTGGTSCTRRGSSQGRGAQQGRCG
jgi:hypothetical protein